MPNKRYTAFNRQNLLLVVIMPGSQQMTIEFTGGYGMNNEAYYFTADADIQNMLESDPRFNEKYRLTEIDNVSVPEYEARKQIKEAKAEVKVNPEPKPEVVVTEVPKKEVVKKNTFTNLQEARNYLNAQYNVPFHLISNKQKLKEKAKELGMDIILETDNK